MRQREAVIFRRQLLVVAVAVVVAVVVTLVAAVILFLMSPSPFQLIMKRLMKIECALVGVEIVS